MNSSGRAQARSSARFWRFASGFLFFATLTVVAGYYVPLRREAIRLRAEQTALRRQLEETTRALEAVPAASPSAQVPSATAPAAATQNGAAQPNAGDIAQRREHLEASLRSQFAELIQQRQLNVSSAGDRVSVAVASSLLFPGGAPQMSTGGRTLLCQLAKSIMADFSGQLRITGYYGKPRIVEPRLARRYATPWQLSAVRAAQAVAVLERDCRAPTERFLVVGYGPRSAGPLGENVAMEFIFAGSD
jgi:flagellar motor protein MotB